LVNTITQGNDARLGTIDIDETNKSDGYVQVYNSATNKLEYQAISQDLSGYLRKVDNLNSVANKQTAINNITQVSSGATAAVLTKDGSGNASWITPASGGNVSVTGVTAVVGAPVVFGNTTGTAVIAGTNTAAQRQIYSKAQNLVASYTSTERDTLTWTNGDTIFNNTTYAVESYINNSWVQNYRDTTDFISWHANGVSGGGTLLGSATWRTDGNSGLRDSVFLTTNANDQQGFWWKNIPQMAHKRIILKADYCIGGGNGADGMYYSLFANSAPVAGNSRITQNNSYTIL
jgi:hypothetical protein